MHHLGIDSIEFEFRGNRVIIYFYIYKGSCKAEDALGYIAEQMYDMDLDINEVLESEGTSFSFEVTDSIEFSKQLALIFSQFDIYAVKLGITGFLELKTRFFTTFNFYQMSLAQSIMHTELDDSNVTNADVSDSVPNRVEPNDRLLGTSSVSFGGDYYVKAQYEADLAAALVASIRQDIVSPRGDDQEYVAAKVATMTEDELLRIAIEESIKQQQREARVAKAKEYVASGIMPPPVKKLVAKQLNGMKAKKNTKRRRCFFDEGRAKGEVRKLKHNCTNNK